MKDITGRVLRESEIILKDGSTIRQIAKITKLSKSTIHKDLTEKLYQIDKNRYYKVREVLNYHLKIRHIKGGQSTKQKYLHSNDRH